MSFRLTLIYYSILIPLLMVACNTKQNISASQEFNSVYRNFNYFNHYDTLSNSLDSVFRLHPDLPFTDKFNYYSFKCGFYLTNKHDNEKALIYSDSLLLVVNTYKKDPANDFTKQSVASLAKGSALFNLKRYNDALQYLYESKVSAEASNKPDTKSDLYYALAMVMFKKTLYNEAAQYFTTAFQQPVLGQPLSFSKFYKNQEVLNNIVESYLMANKPDSALLYYPAVKNYISHNEHLFTDSAEKELIIIAKAVADGTAGLAYLLKNDTKGEALLRQSIAVHSLPKNDHVNAIQMQLGLAQFYLDTAFRKMELQKASQILSDIKKGIDTVRHEEYEAKLSYLMSRYYDATGNEANELSHLKKYIAYEKKKASENKLLSETDISTFFQSMQNRYEMKLLKKNNQIERVYLVISALLFVLCSVIILLIWRNWQHSKKHVGVLTYLNQKIRQQKKTLEETVSILNKQSEEKDHILRVVAHDLRNPISAIYAMARISKEDTTLNTEQAECLELIDNASRESLELIDSIMQIKDSSYLENTDKQMHDINELVQSCVNQLKAPANEKNQSLIFRLPNEPQFVFIDPVKMQRVVKNLLINAIKFSHKGSSIEVSIKQKDKDIIIKVKDEGIGIPANLKDKVFDVFTEAKRPGTEQEKTFGLGLSICKQFVEAHGGKIWFSSEENKGTTFYIQLNKEKTPEVASHYNES